ncbi:hypothetical protein SADUNF_Sadunf18G0108600 [Salix dunnii]|uniref:Uncharacterized protein n=1 Tax=Salix dunnii TaxID=1413687 RepID=A0A835MJ95_9ROSI|nr:hypothetical protein SADUNF_Sadunf18G0108600 [Salix dunnii]
MTAIRNSATLGVASVGFASGSRSAIETDVSTSNSGGFEGEKESGVDQSSEGYENFNVGFDWRGLCEIMIDMKITVWDHITDWKSSFLNHISSDLRSIGYFDLTHRNHESASTLTTQVISSSGRDWWISGFICLPFMLSSGHCFDCCHGLPLLVRREKQEKFLLFYYVCNNTTKQCPAKSHNIFPAESGSGAGSCYPSIGPPPPADADMDTSIRHDIYLDGMI